MALLQLNDRVWARTANSSSTAPQPSIWSTAAASGCSVWTAMSSWPALTDAVQAKQDSAEIINKNKAKSPILTLEDELNMDFQAKATLRELQIPVCVQSDQGRLTREKRSSTVTSSSSSASSRHEDNTTLQHPASSDWSSSSSSRDSSVNPDEESECFAIKRNKSNNTSSTESTLVTAVFIGRLPFDLTEKEFQSKIAEFSPIDCCICMNKRKKSKGFGFANFATEEAAQKFVKYANDAFLFPSQKLALRVEVCRR